MEKTWARSWPKYLPQECIYPFGEIPVHEYLRRQAKAVPDRPAIIFYGREVTYRELDESSDKFAAYLVKNGIGKGDRVGLYLANSPQYIIAHFGVLKMGGVLCPLNSLFKEMELKYQINDAGVSAVVMQDLNAQRLYNVKGELPTVKKYVYTNFNDYLPESPAMPLLPYMSIKGQRLDWADSFLDIMQGEKAAPVKVDISMDDLALFEYTGGSTGMPKGAMHTHTSHLFKPLSFAIIRALKHDSVEITPMPYFHIAGMTCMVGDVLAGSTNICLAQFDPVAVFQAVEKYKATNMYSAVPMNVQMMQHPDAGKYDISSLKTAITTSFVIALNDDIARRWSAFTKGGTIVEAAYGLSETHTADTFMPRDKVKYGSVGIPNYHTDIKILDINDRSREMPAGEQGEIAVKTRSLMAGYWNKKEETEKCMLGGYLLTGDIGRFDEDGYLYWMGRLKEMIKVSGHSVFPEEVEALLNQSPDIAESAVIPVPDEKKGEVVKAFVVLKPARKGQVKPEDIIQWARANMTPHKSPVYVEFRDELPKSGVKLLRRILKEEEEKKAR